MTRTLLVAGGGGVGKTTIAAALAVVSARRGRRTLVVTVDPARRLAAALGISRLGGEPEPADGEPGLDAAMLDAAASWDAAVLRHAPPDAARRLLDSPYFHAVADRFPAGQSYAAADQMLDLWDRGRWDTMIVDTPPAAGGIDFFTAPRQIRRLVGGRALRLTTGAGLPGRRRLYSLTAKPMLKLADAVLGSQLLQDVAEFLLDLRATYDGVSERAAAIERRLQQAVTVVVTTADPSPLVEAARFYQELPDVAAPPSAVIFNRALPLEWAAPADLPREVPAEARGTLEANLARWGGEARRQLDARQAFVSRHRTTPAELPWVADPPTTRDSLAALIAAGRGLDLDALLGGSDG